ncbi:MAG TPA: VOC family protein [Kofleriaceae bacterium]|jgi:catechol 2,3-dioxygenase-like lactoylglutathione lyase family enzyme
MFDHISLAVTDLERARRFYDATLAALGHVRLFSTPRAVGYGVPGDPPGKDRFALLLRPAAPAGDGAHLAFAAGSTAAVDAFHAAALAHGGTDRGAPGLRPQYDAGYYAAFVRDPDGNNLEAVHHIEAGPS